ncbi:hypothetical protein EG346_15855 [Chryseobacterium carnipullorum]|uniref:Uncharacterized protein n=1 Tax=Chryseobacterium carnipullorum TaxID=1124835 RepID=A0A376DTW3_CHRCU|nr:hypothetical protein [Chryseobacterium carnipullorum]AZA49560.1 hypothetical protein EG346_15855 [Chryseobacterium carnipullorum]AZA64457.1 hypothetical protein EG345_06870 [Chryseobacterium carnipullorum]STC94819.1 Uncharacterised protein [Chryseobacterium carnipullorum]
MKTFKIKTQNHLILGIIGALKTCSTGQGIRIMYDLKINRGNYDTQIEFVRKDGKDINAVDFFMLGYIVGRDYNN